MKLPFPIRGTEEWDEREHMRKFQLGCRCISFGAINPRENVEGQYREAISRPINKCRVMPNANRLAELRANARERKEALIGRNR